MARGVAARYDDGGQLLTGSLMDYALPRADTMPEAFDIVHLSTPSPLTVAGIKGMGEGGTVGVVAAIANAVADALAPLDPAVNRLPLTPDRVQALARGARGACRDRHDPRRHVRRPSPARRGQPCARRSTPRRCSTGSTSRAS